ncbi:hypothetical protein D9615_006932 [Tricholomella constricta]|uniref:Uncharacterized protein n=1 Tax=Tricholomella constricta TaxID=117010 RepID=A0A8H5H8S9_9AGAR|nr:hypothetical protein D9615_006932 [Tricholomella constricta]
MATTTHNPAPFSRLSRFSLGLGLKSSSASPSRARGSEKQGTEDEWYIPYSGPYEPPREPFRPRTERDSWGDPINGGEGEDDTALASIELHKRYDVGSNSHAGDDHWNGVGDNSRIGRSGDRDGSSTRHRDRAQSAISGRTVSSGMVDPSRASMATQRRSTISSSQRPPVPSYINLDAVGGVGESPMPPTHQRNSSKDNNRMSFTGLFAFGGQARNKSPSGRSTKKLFARKLSRPNQPPSGIGPTTATHRRSSSTGSNSLLGRSNAATGRNHGDAEPAEDDDYYNSYYFSTRASQNLSPTARPTYPNDEPKAGKMTPSPTSSARHPYAYVFPTSHVDEGPQTAPPSFSARPDPSRHVDAPRLTFTQPPAPIQKPASANVAQPQFSIPRSFPFQRGIKPLKNSASTPELRLGVASTSNSSLSRPKGPHSKTSPTFKPKDRWLSAETWCDAILFPRPRLKIKHDNIENRSSGRIVSPPGSPIRRGLGENPLRNETAEQGVASRVLAHSRSLIDLGQTRRDMDAVAAVPSTSQTGLLPPQDGLPLPIRTDQPLRPKSWALDDLDLPTPVPSLARVLEEGEKLDTQRKQWQEQATHSFQNKLTRNISRARSKSLTQKGRRHNEPPPSNIDFLAARAYLGNQLRAPVVTDQKLADAQVASLSSGPFSKSSHSNSNSLSKTWSKSSKSHSRGHSRTDSWGRSARRVAKTATCGLAGTDTGASTSTSDNGLESALKGGGTKIIRLVDPALSAPIDLTPLTSNSPTPSGSTASDARIGIALSTPPSADDPLELGAMRLPAHPYAQGGLYSYSTYAPREKEENDTGASKSAVTGQTPKAASTAALDLFSRETETPSPSVLNHPYAQHTSSRDSYIPDNKPLVRRPRDDSDVPPPAKMWAQLSPGIVREILPGEIQYSPFMSENGDDADASSRNSRAINDTVGVGEALAYAVRPMTSRDSGLGTSEDHTVVDSSQPQAAGITVKRSYRQAVQYDAMRPPHLTLQDKKPSDPYSAHTFASSPLLHQQATPPELPFLSSSRSYELLGPRTISTSPESLSPPHSPRSFGNPDDLDQFYDLFYKPGHSSTHQKVPSEKSSVSVTGTPLGSRRRAGSGLTSLARQLSEELEHMALERDGSQYSRASTAELSSSISRRPADSTLEFVFEEASPPESSMTGRSPRGHSTISPFQPSSARIPEDVESSRASSPLEPDEDETELFRVGVVESVSTPPPVANDHRSSFMGQLSYTNTQHHRTEEQDILARSPQPRIKSGLQPPLADPTRSSYMTTSTASRMSGLSDFPAPPERHPVEHMSLLTSYFDEAHSLSEANASRSTTPPPALPTSSFDDTVGRNRRLTFNGEEEIEELVAALSSHSHSTTHS